MPLCVDIPVKEVQRYMGYHGIAEVTPDMQERINKAIDQVGMLDEDFFMYGEDIDLSYRLLKGGWQNWYLPLDIIHYKGQSTQKSDFRYVHVFYQAMLIFFRKHYSHLSFFFTLPVKVAIYFRASLALADLIRKKLHLG